MKETLTPQQAEVLKELLQDEKRAREKFDPSVMQKLFDFLAAMTELQKLRGLNGPDLKSLVAFMLDGADLSSDSASNQAAEFRRRFFIACGIPEKSTDAFSALFDLQAALMQSSYGAEFAKAMQGQSVEVQP